MYFLSSTKKLLRDKNEQFTKFQGFQAEIAQIPGFIAFLGQIPWLPGYMLEFPDFSRVAGNPARRLFHESVMGVSIFNNFEEYRFLIILTVKMALTTLLLFGAASFANNFTTN